MSHIVETVCFIGFYFMTLISLENSYFVQLSITCIFGTVIAVVTIVSCETLSSLLIVIS